MANPYERTPGKIIDPPTHWSGTLKRLGPGFVLSASIVGSGELIATTIFGARAGFVCLWLILLSCLVKVAVQIEFGRYTIYSGKTSMQALDDLPGPRFGRNRAGWAVWGWFVIMSLKTLQVGGVIGGVALVFTALVDLGPYSQIIWTVVAATLTIMVVSRGVYEPIEKWSIIMIGLFTAFSTTGAWKILRRRCRRRILLLSRNSASGTRAFQSPFGRSGSARRLNPGND